MIKTILDFILSFIGTVLLLPLFCILGILIYLDIGAPILFIQKRPGINGKPFYFFKFRTMTNVMDANDNLLPDAERLTTLGKILRVTSLDEIPSLFNVLKGEMSLVGPRPERPIFVEDFKKSIPHYMLRLKMKAGLTGWAQVNGWRGNTSLEKRIEYDLYYIKNWSFVFDLKIMVMTLWKGILNRHAY